MRGSPATFILLRPAALPATFFPLLLRLTHSLACPQYNGSSSKAGMRWSVGDVRESGAVCTMKIHPGFLSQASIQWGLRAMVAVVTSFGKTHLVSCVEMQLVL